MTERRPIKLLSPEVARKIAAGEVIDRPNAIVRELLDNAVDSGADQIQVDIEGGGIDSIRIHDNGSGMTKDDLLNCAKPHATSKITSETDLLNLSTLGFRGEALASIAAVSRLTICSGEWKLKASAAAENQVSTSTYIEGTTVISENLFENFPARRVFLKRPASETKMCHTTFVEKAMARPDIGFRLTIDGNIRADLRENQTLKHRFISALELRENEDLFHEIKQKDAKGDWSFSLIIGDPSVSRNDRKDIYIYVNGRRITEYALLQAIEYGCQGYFPNGTHPIAGLFVQMKSDLVDFNIHPAKREARFKDMAGLHHGVSSAVRSFFHDFTVKTMKQEEETPYLADLALSSSKPSAVSKDTFFSKTEKPAFSSSGSSYGNYGKKEFSRPEPVSVHSLPKKEISSSPVQSEKKEENSVFFPKQDKSLKLIGTTLGTFIVAEKNDILYIIDQHAAHERFLYDQLLSEQNVKQELLVPMTIEVQSQDDDEYMASIQEELKKFGFCSTRVKDFTWEFSSINSRWKGTALDLEKELLEKHLEPKELIAKIAASTACKAAVKDGYPIDRNTALDLAEKALALDDPHCPHGRPVYTMLSRDQLFSMVKRT